MAVNVMIFGGHRDGEILQVPGELGVPKSRTIRFHMRPKPPISSSPNEYGNREDIEILDLHIVPRKASTGPAWKIELPKELW